jgi:hypothetical protein
MIDKVYFNNPAVNSGLNVDMLANNISVSWESYTRVQGTPKKDLNGTINDGLGRGVNTGFNNPTISISGNYDLSASHVTGSTALIDYEYLEEFTRRSDQTCVLINSMFVSTSNVSGSIDVLFKNFNINNNNSNVVNYNVEFVRVKEE